MGSRLVQDGLLWKLERRGNTQSGLGDKKQACAFPLFCCGANLWSRFDRFSEEVAGPYFILIFL